METLTAAAIVTLLLTKMIEKVGEQVGEKLPELGAKALEQMGNLKKMLWRKAPDTAGAIERVTNLPELVEQQPQDYSLEVLTEKMELAAKDPEVAEIIELLAAEIRPKLSSNVVLKMASGITVKGSLTAKNMTHKIKPGSTDVNMETFTDINVGGDMNLGDLSQEA
jgi:hypothetical protein